MRPPARTLESLAAIPAAGEQQGKIMVMQNKLWMRGAVLGCTFAMVSAVSAQDREVREVEL